MSDNKQLQLACDTNIISACLEQPASSLYRLVSSNSTQTLISPIVWNELLEGTHRGEIDFLRKIDAKVISGNYAEERWIISDLPNEAISLDNGLHPAFGDMYRSIAGTKSQPDVLGRVIDVFDKSIRQALTDIDEADSEAIAPILNSLYREHSDAVSANALEIPIKMEVLPDEAQHVLKEYGLGKITLQNLKPPNIIEKIINSIKNSEKAIILENLPSSSTRTKESFLQLAMTLASWGFFPGKGIQSKDNKKSQRAAMSQLRDFEVIADCCVANTFLTADGDCARIGFALYEYFEVPNYILFQYRKRILSDKPKVIGPEFWPE